MKVLVYSTPTCPYCVKAKEYFTDNKIDFVNYNVAEDVEKAKEMVDKSGQMGVPVIDIEGNIIVGFNQSKLAELLKIKNTPK